MRTSIGARPTARSVFAPICPCSCVRGGWLQRVSTSRPSSERPSSHIHILSKFMGPSPPCSPPYKHSNLIKFGHKSNQHGNNAARPYGQTRLHHVEVRPSKSNVQPAVGQPARKLRRPPIQRVGCSHLALHSVDLRLHSANCGGVGCHCKNGSKQTEAENLELRAQETS